MSSHLSAAWPGADLRTVALTPPLLVAALLLLLGDRRVDARHWCSWQFRTCSRKGPLCLTHFMRTCECGADDGRENCPGNATMHQTAGHPELCEACTVRFAWCQWQPWALAHPFYCGEVTDTRERSHCCDPLSGRPLPPSSCHAIFRWPDRRTRRRMVSTRCQSRQQVTVPPEKPLGLYLIGGSCGILVFIMCAYAVYRSYATAELSARRAGGRCQADEGGRVRPPHPQQQQQQQQLVVVTSMNALQGAAPPYSEVAASPETTPLPTVRTDDPPPSYEDAIIGKYS